MTSRKLLLLLAALLILQRTYIWGRCLEVKDRWTSEHASPGPRMTSGVFYDNANMPVSSFPARSMSNPSAKDKMISGSVRFGEDVFELAGVHLCPVGAGEHVYNGSLQVRLDGRQPFSISIASLGSLEANGFAIPDESVPLLLERTAWIVGDNPPPSRQDFTRLLPECAGSDSLDSDKTQLVRLMLSAIHHSLQSRRL